MPAGVCDAIDVMPRHMNCAMDHKSRGVNVVVGSVEQHVAIDVDLDQTGRIDFLIEHAVGIDQEMIGLTGNATRDVVRNQFGHVVHRRQTVAGSQIDAGVPFFRADLFAHRLDNLDRGSIQRRVHGLSP